MTFEEKVRQMLLSELRKIPDLPPVLKTEDVELRRTLNLVVENIRRIKSLLETMIGEMGLK